MASVSLFPYVEWRAEADGQGAVAQLGERLICIQEVAGSIPTSSTSLSRGVLKGRAAVFLTEVRACSSGG